MLEPGVTSVPEPESGPMMLAGVGLLLLLARRRPIGRR
jgi:MYXO-CTERM domain-containing protein